MTLSFTAIEVIAGLFALLVLVKLVTISIKRKAWFKAMVKPSMNRPGTSIIVYLLLAAIIFYFLLQTFTIVEIFAVLAFCSFFIFLGLFAYSKNMLAFAKKIYDKRFNEWCWIQIIIWLALSLWVLYEILF